MIIGDFTSAVAAHESAQRAEYLRRLNDACGAELEIQPSELLAAGAAAGLSAAEVQADFAAVSEVTQGHAQAETLRERIKNMTPEVEAAGKRKDQVGDEIQKLQGELVDLQGTIDQISGLQRILSNTQGELSRQRANRPDLFSTVA